MKHTKIAVYIDLFFCLAILPLIIMLVPVEKWIVHQTDFMLTLIVYLYTLYFIYRKTRLPSLFMQRKFGHILLLMIFLFAITELMSNFPLPEESGPPAIQDFRRHLRTQTIWFFFLVITGFSLSIELTFELFRQILSKQEINAEKNRAELALYKAQIDPHFLFNTLNALYGLVLTRSDRTESAFIKFSDILKYMYTHATAETIDIESELNYIRQYVELQELRLNHRTHVLFESSTDDGSVRIPPMILIAFVENAFKYGTSSDTDCTIRIRIAVKEGQLRFETENAVMKRKQDNVPAIGIENCRKRLELLYPGRFDLKIGEKEGLFRTFLTIRLQ